MNQTSPELETLAAEIEKERNVHGRCRFQQEHDGQTYCTSRTLKCSHKQKALVIVKMYEDEHNWSDSSYYACIYKPMNRRLK